MEEKSSKLDIDFDSLEKYLDKKDTRLSLKVKQSPNRDSLEKFLEEHERRLTSKKKIFPSDDPSGDDRPLKKGLDNNSKWFD